MPKYEKVDDFTIRVIREKGVNVTLSQLLENKTTLLKQKAQIEGALAKVEKILEEAKKLGLKEKPKQPSAQGEPTFIKAAD